MECIGVGSTSSTQLCIRYTELSEIAVSNGRERKSALLRAIYRSVHP